MSPALTEKEPTNVVEISQAFERRREKQLLCALTRGDSDAANALISQGIDLAAPLDGQAGRPRPLEVAIMLGRTAEAVSMIRHGAPLRPQSPDLIHMGALALATLRGNDRVIACMVNYMGQADFFAMATEWMVKAASMGRIRDLYTLSRVGMPLDCVGAGGITPLHAAALNKDANIVEFLVMSGVGTEVVDETGRRASDLVRENLPGLAARLKLGMAPVVSLAVAACPRR